MAEDKRDTTNFMIKLGSSLFLYVTVLDLEYESYPTTAWILSITIGIILGGMITDELLNWYLDDMKKKLDDKE